MLSRCSQLLKIVVTALALAAATFVAGCADGGDAPELQIAQSTGSQIELSRIYRLGVGDKLKITVFGEQDLSGTYDVNATGNVSLPLIGDIVAKGRPIGDFRNVVAKRLGDGYIKNPKITVEVLAYRPIYVHGEVKQAGELAYKSGLKLRDAVAMAGGYTYRANQTYLLIIREGQSTEAKVRLPSDLDVLPGDNIRVPERLF